MKLLIQAILDGILLGGIYATLGLGINLVHGVLHIINWAAGETLVLGLFLAFLLVSQFGMDPYITILFTFILVGALGFLMQRVAISPLMDRSGERAGPNALLFTAGYGYVVSSVMEMIFGTLSHSAVTRYTGKSISIGFLYAPVPKVISCVIAVTATILLYICMQRTEIGRAIRATAQDRKTAQLMGVNSRLMFCVGFGLSFALIGMTASLLIPYYPVTPYIGVAFSFKAFIISVIGGERNVLGALCGGMFVGLVEKVAGSLISDSFAQILVFLLFIVVLLVRPDGLLGHKKTA